MAFHPIKLLVGSTVLLCLGCEVDPPAEPARPQIPNLSHCYYQSNHDSISLTQGLLGEWNWRAKQCFWTWEYGAQPADKSVTVEFLSDQAYSSTIDDSTTLGTWHLAEPDTVNNRWQIEMTPFNPYFFGYAFLCGDSLIMYSSYIDGCDNLFVRVQ